MVTRSAYLALLGLVALERGVELAVSRRNARAALAAGGVEVGRRHYAVMVAFHAAFLAACALEAVTVAVPPDGVRSAVLVALVAQAQALRWWSVATLGARWNTRIITWPGAAPVTRGPYRLLRHPNYLAVAVELAALPLAFGCWRTAVAFSAGNAVLMAVRIPAEERALGAAYASAFASTPRFVPAIRGAREERS